MLSQLPPVNIDLIVSEIEALLSAEHFDPQEICCLLSNLDRTIADLAVAAKSDPLAVEQLQTLNHWFDKTRQHILSEHTKVVTNLKELHTGRKASHNYRQNT
ncbi:hypothetical protein [Paraglaciecola sp.]|uniref:hypothetical protein n=1 Tax=Paraglaciecola sp. TaxID=1920173 RepID=UPI00273ED79E|nr:hypothetical protein [Paraglaciecola sp.]MDP5028844.1 hypothetical protein [Paraglaciecola sp.]